MHCLVVDPNAAFATLLSEELVRLGHVVTTCASAAEAYAAAQKVAPSQEPHLALLDMALQEPDALTLGHQLRALLPAIRLVLIPMIGEAPVLGPDAPVIQGVLPKPFFLPDLPARIEAAFSASADHQPVPAPAGGGNLAPPALLSETAAGPPPAQDPHSLDWMRAFGDAPSDDGDDDAEPENAVRGVSVSGTGGDLAWLDAFASPPAGRSAKPEIAAPPQPVPPVAVPPAVEVEEGASGGSGAPAPRGISRRALRTNQTAIDSVLRELVNEVGADAVLLACETGVLAWAGSLDETEVASISEAVLISRRASEEVARVLGREQLLFEQSIAGGSYLLYALNVYDAVLAVTASGSASLGLLRHSTRSAGERLAELCAIG